MLAARHCPLAGQGISRGPAALQGSAAAVVAAAPGPHCHRRFLQTYSNTTNRVPSSSRHIIARLSRPAQLRTIFTTTSPKLQARSDEMAEPTGLVAKSGIELLTFGTPNGFKASILLEELKEAYGKEYTYQSINISKNTQKEPWYTALNPNGRIPTIIDHDRNGFAVFEGLAILTYLTRHYDPEYKFSFPVDSDDYSVAEQWISWQHGGIGPMQGQAGHFLRAAPEKIAWGITRYVGETERLYGILNARLADRDYIVGPGRGKYSIADISLIGWVNASLYAGIDLASQFPNVRAWLDRLLARPAVQKGLTVPSGQPSRFSVPTAERALKGEPGLEDVKDSLEATKKLVADAKEKYNYKYSSP